MKYRKIKYVYNSIYMKKNSYMNKLKNYRIRYMIKKNN